MRGRRRFAVGRCPGSGPSWSGVVSARLGFDGVTFLAALVARNGGTFREAIAGTFASAGSVASPSMAAAGPCASKAWAQAAGVLACGRDVVVGVVALSWGGRLFSLVVVSVGASGASDSLPDQFRCERAPESGPSRRRPTASRDSPRSALAPRAPMQYAANHAPIFVS